MIRNLFAWRSLKTRVTLFTLAIFVTSVWALALYASRMLHENMERISGEQQFSTVTFIAAEVNADLALRQDSLEQYARLRIDPAALASAAAMQARLEESPILQSMFNGGLWVAGRDGVVMASVPPGRGGTNFMDREYLITALKEGKSTISKPVLGRVSTASSFAMATPIRDAQSKVVGALVGVTELDKPNFLDKLTASRYGKTGGYLLVAPQQRQIIIATDKARIMEILPAPGVNRFVDRHIQGYEGFDVIVNAQGVQVLASIKRVPVTGWYVAATLPTAEAFAPIHDMRQRFLLAAILLTLLAGVLTWWMVRRQLSPMLAAAKTLLSLSNSRMPLQPLAITRRDEIGELIGGFNRLIETLGKQGGELRESEQRFRAIIEASPVPLALNDEQGNITYLNRAFALSTGYTANDIPTLADWWPRAYPDIAYRQQVADKWRGNLEAAQRGGTAFAPMEVDIRCKDDSVRTFLASAAAFDGGASGTHVVILYDITERKRSEMVLRTRLRLSELGQTGTLEELLQAALDAGEEITGSSIGFFHFVDPDQEHLTLQAWSTNTMKHMCSAEGKGQHYAISAAGVWVDAFHRREPVIHNDYASLPHKKGMPEGHARVTRELVVPILRAGKVTEILGVGNKASDYTQADVDALQIIAGLVQDLVERRRMNAALSESESRLSAVFQASPIGIVVSRVEDGRILDVNDAALRLFGYGRDEAIGRTVAELGTYAYPEQREQLVQQLREHGSAEGFRIDFRRKSGEVGVIESSARVIELQGEHCLLAMMMDVTERMRTEKEKALLETQFQQAQKMESVGRLAGGVAHDFNNMLTVIRGNVALAIEQVDAAQAIHTELAEIRKAADRSTDLTRQLLAFARKQVVTPKVLDLNVTLAGITSMLQRLIGEDINLKWLPQTNLWPVLVDSSQIDQILANLCINARDAIAGVGNIVIETGNSSIDRQYCAAHPEFVPGDYVRIAVSDDGGGMDKETLDHIFEPFFTTKGAGEGTGLGLATVYGAVKQNNGLIDVRSEIGAGTTFTIYLPRHGSGVEQAVKTGADQPRAGGHETILLVEDEPSILKLTERILARQGYTVLAARTPGEARHLAAVHASAIHLLMTDVVMPEMNGRDLAKDLQSRHPRLKVLFMSGYTADIIVHQGVVDEGVNFIQKPFAIDDLAAKVREVLDRVQG